MGISSEAIGGPKDPSHSRCRFHISNQLRFSSLNNTDEENRKNLIPNLQSSLPAFYFKYIKEIRKHTKEIIPYTISNIYTLMYIHELF